MTLVITEATKISSNLCGPFKISLLINGFHVKKMPLLNASYLVFALICFMYLFFSTLTREFSLDEIQGKPICGNL